MIDSPVPDFRGLLRTPPPKPVTTQVMPSPEVSPVQPPGFQVASQAGSILTMIGGGAQKLAKAEDRVIAKGGELTDTPIGGDWNPDVLETKLIESAKKGLKPDQVATRLLLDIAEVNPKALASLQTPKNLATLGAMFALPEVGLPKLIQGLIGAGMTGSAALSAGRKFYQAVKHYQTYSETKKPEDLDKIVDSIGSGALDGVFAALGAYSGAKEPSGRRPSPKPIEPTKPPQLEPPTIDVRPTGRETSQPPGISAPPTPTEPVALSPTSSTQSPVIVSSGPSGTSPESAKIDLEPKIEARPESKPLSGLQPPEPPKAAQPATALGVLSEGSEVKEPTLEAKPSPAGAGVSETPIASPPGSSELALEELRVDSVTPAGFGTGSLNIEVRSPRPISEEEFKSKIVKPHLGPGEQAEVSKLRSAVMEANVPGRQMFRVDVFKDRGQSNEAGQRIADSLGGFGAKVRVQAKPPVSAPLHPAPRFGPGTNTFTVQVGPYQATYSEDAFGIERELSVKDAQGQEIAKLDPQIPKAKESDIRRVAEKVIRAHEAKSATPVEAPKVEEAEPEPVKLSHEQVQQNNYNQSRDIFTVPVSDIEVDPERFQFKRDTGEGGASGKMKKAKAWDPAAGGSISLWKDPSNEKVYVVNGHHRLDLAKRLGVQDVNARFVDAETSQGAMVAGALQNIREGQGTPIDAARVFRIMSEPPEKIAEAIGLTDRRVEEAVGLARLSEPIWNKVWSGQLDYKAAAIIGELTEDPDVQDSAVKMIESKEGAKLDEDEIRYAIRFAIGAPVVSETQSGLFGSMETMRSLAMEKAKLASEIERRIVTEKMIFSAVERGAGEIESRGIGKVSENEARKAAIQARAAKLIFSRLADKAGSINDALNRAVIALEEKQDAREVKNKLYQEIFSSVTQIVAGRE